MLIITRIIDTDISWVRIILSAFLCESRTVGSVQSIWFGKWQTIDFDHSWQFGSTTTPLQTPLAFFHLTWLKRRLSGIDQKAEKPMSHSNVLWPSWWAHLSTKLD